MSVKFYLNEVSPFTGGPRIKNVWTNFWREWITHPDNLDITEFLARYYPFITAKLESDLSKIGYLEFDTESHLTWFLLRYS